MLGEIILQDREYGKGDKGFSFTGKSRVQKSVICGCMRGEGGEKEGFKGDYTHPSMALRVISYFHRKSSPFKKDPFSPTIYFCTIEGFDTGVSCGAPSAAARGWHQVAQQMHNPNGIIGAHSASQLAPHSVTATGHECLCSSASLPSHCNQKYTMRSNIFVLDRILSQSGT